MERRWWRWFSHSVVSNSCDPMDCSLQGSSVHGILQARILEWVAISFPKGDQLKSGLNPYEFTDGILLMLITIEVYKHFHRQQFSPVLCCVLFYILKHPEMEAYLVLLCFKVLFLWGVLFFHKWNVCGNSALSTSIRALSFQLHFVTLCLCVSLW